MATEAAAIAQAKWEAVEGKLGKAVQKLQHDFLLLHQERPPCPLHEKERFIKIHLLKKKNKNQLIKASFKYIVALKKVKTIQGHRLRMAQSQLKKQKTLL